MGYSSRTSGGMGKSVELARMVEVRAAEAEVSGAALEVTTLDIYIHQLSFHNSGFFIYTQHSLTLALRLMDVPVISIRTKYKKEKEKNWRESENRIQAKTGA